MDAFLTQCVTQCVRAGFDRDFVIRCFTPGPRVYFGICVSPEVYSVYEKKTDTTMRDAELYMQTLIKGPTDVVLRLRVKSSGERTLAKLLEDADRISEQEGVLKDYLYKHKLLHPEFFQSALLRGVVNLVRGQKSELEKSESVYSFDWECLFPVYGEVVVGLRLDTYPEAQEFSF